VDITHQVPNYDILQAAFTLQNCISAFPPGTVHLIAVDPEATDCPTGKIITFEGQHFIGPDNGILSLICNRAVKEGIEIVESSQMRANFPRSFRAARFYAPVAALLARDGNPAAFGPLRPIRELHWGDPTYVSNCLRGKIIHIDKFGNAITNIQRDHFMEVKNGRRFEIFIRSLRLRRIVHTYSDVGKADALAIFGESHNLEIAMREASAAELLGLKVNDMITIEFSA
jgi:S-adenosylmethionine hydrolase